MGDEETLSRPKLARLTLGWLLSELSLLLLVVLALSWFALSEVFGRLMLHY